MCFDAPETVQPMSFAMSDAGSGSPSHNAAKIVHRFSQPMALISLVRGGSGGVGVGVVEEGLSMVFALFGQNNASGGPSTSLNSQQIVSYSSLIVADSCSIKLYG
jgi:hypothetical protein